ncbi:MAG: flagellar assembly protein FliW [Pirellulaceae bacterium]|nr:flagellar assembly protein FliW [Pirellulaceae bacterium]
MLVQSTRFGNISAKQDDILIFPNGLIGFESTKHWLLVADPENPLIAWLQSTSQPQVALPLISPRKFLPDYKVHLSQRQLTNLHVRSTDQLYVMLVLSKSGKTLTANLRGPIIINLTQRLALQTVVNDPLPLALPLIITETGSIREAA